MGLFGRMGFGGSPIVDIWDRFKDFPVNACFNGHTYSGVVNEIRKDRNTVYLEPIASINFAGDKLTKINKSIMLPHTGVVVTSIEFDTLDEYIEHFNNFKVAEADQAKKEKQLK